MRFPLALLLALLFLCGGAQANPCAMPGLGLDGSGMGGSGHGDGSGTGGTGYGGDGTGMGGTSHQGDGTGTGGTGRRADGQGMGGTGVVGVITGFGSICVNGLRVTFDADTPVRVDGEAGSTAQLAIGQLVSVDAEGSGSTLRARRIALISALVGPIGWVSPEDDGFVVLGQRVRLVNESVRPESRPKPGDFVRVSGLRDAAGNVQATRVDHIAHRAQVSLTAPLDYRTGNVGRIGALNVVGVKSLPVGQEARLTGVLENGVLVVRQARIAPALEFASRPERLVLQGVLRRGGDASALDIGYARVAVPAGMANAGKPGQWVRIEARVHANGKLDAVRLDTLRADHRGREGTDGNPPLQRAPQPAGMAEKAAVPEIAATVEKIDKVEKTEKVERIEKVEKVEKPEKVEKVEKVEKPERVEKIERPERIEKPEKPERPEKADR